MTERKAIEKEERKAQAERDEVVSSGKPDLAGVDNRELAAADFEVGSSKTVLAERGTVHAQSHNRTITGLPSDVHQALVSAANHFRPAALAFEELDAVLTKYNDKETEDLPDEVEDALRAAHKDLRLGSQMYKDLRVLLEKHTA